VTCNLAILRDSKNGTSQPTLIDGPVQYRAENSLLHVNL